MIFIALAILGFIIWAIIYQRKKAAAFLAAMQELTWSRGWTFRQDDWLLPRDFVGFAPFGAGRKRVANWVIDGEINGTWFILMEYQYVTESSDGKGNRSETVHRFVVAVASSQLRGRNLSIGPEHWGHKIFDALGGEDIDFESDEFSRKFWVKCDDRRFAYDVVHPRMIEFLLPRRKWHWQWRGNQLVMHQAGNLKIENIVPMVEQLNGFLKLLPRHLMATKKQPRQ